MHARVSTISYSNTTWKFYYYPLLVSDLTYFAANLEANLEAQKRPEEPSRSKSEFQEVWGGPWHARGKFANPQKNLLADLWSPQWSCGRNFIGHLVESKFYFWPKKMASQSNKIYSSESFWKFRKLGTAITVSPRKHVDWTDMLRDKIMPCLKNPISSVTGTPEEQKVFFE